MRLLLLYILNTVLLTVTITEVTHAQLLNEDVTEIANTSSRKITDAASRKASFIETRLKKSSDWMLRKLEKEEARIQKKLAKLDSSKAAQLFTNGNQFLNKADSSLKTVENSVQKLAQQFPGVDELKTTLGFLQTTKSKTAVLQQQAQRFNDLKTKLAGVQNELERSAIIEQYLDERKQLLTEQLRGLNFDRHLSKINKHAGAYTQLVRDYKNILNDPVRLQQLAIEKLKRIPAFNDFMARNSALAALMPGGGGGGFDPAQLAGMQTQVLTSQLVQNTVNTGGPNAGQIVIQQIQQAQGAMQNILNRVNGNSSQTNMPDYQPQTLRSKTFLQRLEFGANVQFARPNGPLPQTSNWAAQAAYKFSKKGSLGIGAMYSMGMGSGLNNIRITHNGIGFRSFADFKLKGSFFINGGFEQNYNAAFNRITELNNLNRWTGSALLGISKKYNVSKKLKGNLMLLYDLMHRVNVPATQAILFRFGYNF